MHILVIGGTAFIGPYIIRQLIKQGHDVTVYHRGQSESELPEAVRHIRNPQSPFPITTFAPELDDIRPDVVLHMMAMGERDAQAAMDMFRGKAARIVVASSADVYRAYGRLIGTESGAPDPVPLREDSPLREKLYPYRGPEPKPDDHPARWTDDYDKILVEHIVMSDPELPGTTLRLPMVYGPGDKQHRLHSYLKRMDDGRPAILLDETTSKWQTTRGYVENVAAAIVLAVNDVRATGRIYNVAEPETFEEAAWVRHVGEATGWHGEIVTLPPDKMPTHLASPMDMRQHLVVDTTRIRQELGYQEHVPQAERLRRTVEWERANPPASIDPAQFDYVAEDAVIAQRTHDGAGT